MAKQGKYGDLSWHKGSSRWSKKVKDGLKPDGKAKYKTLYYGKKCKGPSDRAGKKLALDEYQVYVQEQDTANKIQSIQEKVLAVAEGLIPITKLGDTPFEQNFVKKLSRDGKLRTDGYVNLNVVEPDEETRLLRDAFYARVAASRRPVAKPGRKTIAQHIDDWLVLDGKLRVKRQEIKENTLQGITSRIQDFIQYVQDKSFGSSADLTQLLMEYRASLANSDHTNHTINDKTKNIVVFLEWAYDNHHIKEMPRSLKKFSKKLPVEKQGYPLPLEDVRKLFDAAGPRMQCYMLMALNFGWKNGDIIHATGDMLQNKRMIGKRQKTGAPMNYPLWPSTMKMIKQERDRTGADETFFVNTKGNTIDTSTFSNLFKKIVVKTGVTKDGGKTKKKTGDPVLASFEQLRDTSLELVEKDLRRLGADMSQLDIFLAHKDTKTSQYYRTHNPVDMVAPVIDKVVLGLEKTYGLKLDTAPAKPLAKKTRTKTKTKSPKSTKSPSRPELAHLRK